MRRQIFACFLLAVTVMGQRGNCPAAGESFPTGLGQLLHVQVFDTPELEQHARVTDAGRLPLILGGNVKVRALTPGKVLARH